MNPKYPIYIPSKGRAESRLTSKALERMRVPYYIIVEEQEYYEYASVIDKDKILVLDKKYQDEYDTFDDLGYTKSKGPGAARNFAWQHSIEAGDERHWVMDDNLDGFFRLNNNKKVYVESGTIFRCAEDFVDRYENIVMAGLNYDFFVKAVDPVPPYVLNTRIYSCNLIENKANYRWRGRYNEDTDLSLRMLKDGFCTIQFNAFLCGKVATQLLTGGNTDEFYAEEGTKPKSQMLEDMHPDVVKVVYKFNRWHHHVDYSFFRNNRLIRKENYVVKRGVNNYGMILKSGYESYHHDE